MYSNRASRQSFRRLRFPNQSIPDSERQVKSMLAANRRLPFKQVKLN